MIRKTNNLRSQESRKYYVEEAAEETKVLEQGDDKFNGVDDKFEEACAEENAFDAARAEESAARTHSHRAKNMAGYATGKGNDPEEEE